MPHLTATWRQQHILTVKRKDSLQTSFDRISCHAPVCGRKAHQLHGGVPHIARHEFAATLDQQYHCVDVPLHVRVEPVSNGTNESSCRVGITQCAAALDQRDRGVGVLHVQVEPSDQTQHYPLFGAPTKSAAVVNEFTTGLLHWEKLQLAFCAITNSSSADTCSTPLH